ncbi:chemotaxis protein CheX [Metabacillus mangrovi]|nr:chemotaxis protein CheX [Metabacillus mangrovi]
MTRSFYDLIVSSTFESIETMIPGISSSQKEHPLSVLTAVEIGVIGEVEGRLLIEGNEEVFKEMGVALYGMNLEGEMLSSFIGEFANMVAGQVATSLSSKGMAMDITPPRVTGLQSKAKIFAEQPVGMLKVSFLEPTA